MIGEQSRSDIFVYNIAGELVKKLQNDNPDRGVQSVEWDVTGVSAGVYVYYIRTELPGKTMKVGPTKLAIGYQ